jgi:hypothetical protein
MKTHSWPMAKAPCIFKLSSRWRRMITFMLQLLYSQGICLWYPVDKTLGPRALLDKVVIRETSSALSGNQTWASIPSTVTLLIELPLLTLLAH